MIVSLQILNFRCFSHLIVEDLGLVNLFVGTNNCGKTSLLEAVEIFGLGGSPGSLARSLRRRGELTVPAIESAEPELDPSHLFHGHILSLGQPFTISGSNERGEMLGVSCQVVHMRHQEPTEAHSMFSVEEENIGELQELFALEIKSSAIQEDGITFPLSASLGIPTRFMRMPFTPQRESAPEVRFVPTEALDNPSMGVIWDQVVLKPEERFVVDSLKIIESGVERIAFLLKEYSPQYRRSIGSRGVIVKIENCDDPIPLGSLGEGIRRLLSISLAIITCRGGTLLIDEIDTGLHYSVMEKMWRMVIETARRLDVQVFATTHSRDCVDALGMLSRSDPELTSEVRLHRIEKGYGKTTVFKGENLSIAEEQGIEVR